MTKTKFVALYRYAKHVWDSLALGLCFLILLPMLPFVSLGQGGAILMGAVIIAELYFGKIRFEWTKIIELSVARAADIHVITEFSEDDKIHEVGAATIDVKKMFAANIDRSYATISTENINIRPKVLKELIRDDEYSDSVILVTPESTIRPWIYHHTLNRLNSIIETSIVACAIIGTIIWAFGDQFVQWAFCT